MENYIFLNTWQNYTNAYLNYIFFESIPLTNSKTMLIIMYAKSLKIKFLSWDISFQGKYLCFFLLEVCILLEFLEVLLF